MNDFNKITIHIVMGNDYPDSVFAKEEDAETYCVKKREEEKTRQGYSRIYWRVYAFELDAKLPDKRHFPTPPAKEG